MLSSPLKAYRMALCRNIVPEDKGPLSCWKREQLAHQISTFHFRHCRVASYHSAAFFLIFRASTKLSPTNCGLLMSQTLNQSARNGPRSKLHIQKQWSWLHRKLRHFSMKRIKPLPLKGRVNKAKCKSKSKTITTAGFAKAVAIARRPHEHQRNLESGAL